MRKLVFVLNILVTLAVTALFVYLGLTVFYPSYIRFLESLTDLGVSAKFWFCRVFNVGTVPPVTVTGESAVFGWETFLPKEWDTFQGSAKGFFTFIATKEIVSGYFGVVLVVLTNIMKVLVIALPCFFILFAIIKHWYKTPNNDFNRDSIPLRIYKGITRFTVRPIARFIRQYISFVKEHKKLLVGWIVLWVFHFNLASIAISFLAYYLYFSASFDFPSIYVQAGKLISDLQMVFRKVPPWILIVLAWVLFDRFRKRIARARLARMENRNCGFINELPIVSMTCGSMGKKKTTMITDMALSQEVMFREKAFERLQQCDMKFPHFPWIFFEKELQKCMEHGTVYNLATTKSWVRKKRERFERTGNRAQIYGYDYKRYGDTFDDCLKINGLWDVLETYAQLYFIYVIESSLLVSNYSIREDNLLMDEGNFPMWYSDFFPEEYPPKSHHAHILDFDVLRLGRKVIENNPNIGSFEFGVVVISEVGKERGNNLELKEVKRGTEETNQKNDLFNSWLKMCRHSATVDNFPFVKVFADEQRPESWGADARDLCDVVHIVSSSEQKLALPFYTIEEMIAEWLYGKFINLYYDFRFIRGDNTLLMHLLKSITARLYKYNMRIHNRYGYSISKVQTERGTMDGEKEEKVYFLMNKKIYSSRFSTDCFSDYFNEMARKTKVGLMDYPEYMTERATMEELQAQNSYFIRSLYKDEDNNE